MMKLGFKNYVTPKDVSEVDIGFASFKELSWCSVF